MINLDLKDRRILHELDINSRQSYSQIGRKVKLPKTVIFNRINSLIKRGILTATHAQINFTKLGFTQYKIYLKFHSLQPKKEAEIISYLTNKKQIVWIASSRGKWDMAVTIIAKDVVDFDRILKEMIETFGKYIMDKDILIVSYSPLYSRGYILPETEKKELIYMSNIENRELDKIEGEIIRILADDARTPILKIMNKLHITREVASYRIKKLEKSIILNYSIVIDQEAIGYHIYKIMLRLNNFSKAEELKLVSYCGMHPNIIQYIRAVGNWDAEIEVEAENEEKAYEIVNYIRNSFENLVKDYEVLQFYKQYKYHFYPI